MAMERDYYICEDAVTVEGPMEWAMVRIRFEQSEVASEDFQVCEDGSENWLSFSLMEQNLSSQLNNEQLDKSIMGCGAFICLGIVVITLAVIVYLVMVYLKIIDWV